MSPILLLYRSIHPILLLLIKICLVVLKPLNLILKLPLINRPSTGLEKFIETFRMQTIKGRPAYESIEPSLFRHRPVWIHAASGEYEYAKPVIRLLAESGYQVFVTYFSPSYRSAIKKDPNVTASCPLPLDSSTELRNLIKRFNPSHLLIARTDAWPNLLYEAHLAKIPSLLFSATLHSNSKRVRGISKLLTAATYRHLTTAYSVTITDSDWLTELGVKDVQVMGDTRFDQVIDRLKHPQQTFSKIIDLCHKKVFIAGSIWKEDIEKILPIIINETKNRTKDANAIRLTSLLVPHEPSLKFLQQIEKELDAHKISHLRYSKIDFNPEQQPEQKVDIILVDKTGILAELYCLGDISFIGGSFKSSVHSVMEPLAAGLISIVGPHYTNNREAIEFSQISIPGTSMTPVIVTNNENEFAVALKSGLLESSKISKKTIKELVQRHCGASSNILSWVKNHNSK